MSVIIPADATDAFSHLFMIGLASILEDADAEGYVYSVGRTLCRRLS